LDINTAVLEYQQISPLMPPGTLVSYRLTVDPVVDFTSGYQSSKWSALWEDFYCDWRACWFNQRIEPPSWIIGDEVIANGGKRILFRSGLSPGGVNLVHYVDELGPNDQLAVYDPQATLQRNQSSWK
jgi:RES domain-containing protein